uniref:Uncharacterized protein n=1 Tax=Otolemur garnettii TaxID=30611 RepID=H0XL29_OTOGA
VEAGSGPGSGLCHKPGRLLDMNHGFVHHLPYYPKKLKQAARRSQTRKWTRSASTHPGAADYEESCESSSSGGSELEPSGHQLFCLEYEADSGGDTSVIVYQDHDSGRVSEEVSAHTPLDPLSKGPQVGLQEETAKHQSRH